MATVIEVTAEDIAAGEPLEQCACPVALAMGRAFPGRAVRVGDLKAAIGDGLAYLPAEALAFIRDFDAGRPVAPFTFTLED